MFLLCFLAFVVEGYKIEPCKTAPAVPKDTRPDKTVLRVGTFNCEWLFLDNWQKNWPSREEAVEHLHLIADVLRILNYDVLNLVEVESCNVLQQLIAAIGDSSYRAYLVPGTDTATGQNVALLTRVDPIEDLWRTANRIDYPIPGSTCGYSGTGTYGVSKHYFTRIHPENFPVIFLAGAHLLAFPDRTDRCSFREAQATVLKDIVLREVKKSEEFIVFGDLNDWDGSVLDVVSSRPISKVLQILKDIDPTAPGDELHNIGIIAPQGDRFTAYYSPSSCKPKNLGSSSIDHMLVSADLLKMASAGNPFKTSLYNAPCATQLPMSDHWPIQVVLRSK